MTRLTDLKHLSRLADMIEADRLSQVAQVSAVRNDWLSQLDLLKRDATAPLSASDDAEQRQREIVAQTSTWILHQRWASARRAEINVRLAASTAQWINARDAARKAHGRAEVLRRLADEHAKGLKTSGQMRC